MTKQNKTFIDKLKTFALGQPIPVLNENDMQEVRNLNQRLDTLLNQNGANQFSPQIGQHATGSSAAHIGETLNDLSQQVRKLAKTQFKTNTLQESQQARQEEMLAGLKESLTQQKELSAELKRQQEQIIEAVRIELLESLLPVLDSLDAAFNAGRRQVLGFQMKPEARRGIIAWLDGVRLARMRLQDILEANNVTPIPTVGQPFDPHRHIAVATDSSGQAPDGVIISEDRRGYQTPHKIIRFAEVVVARSN